MTIDCVVSLDRVTTTTHKEVRSDDSIRQIKWGSHLHKV